MLLEGLQGGAGGYRNHAILHIEQKIVPRIMSIQTAVLFESKHLSFTCEVSKSSFKKWNGRNFEGFDVSHPPMHKIK